MKTETGGGVIFACSGVEPREGQTPVVVGSSSELGGWDASRGITLHRVKNPAFPGVWMSLPMFHSASCLPSSDRAPAFLTSALAAAAPTDGRSQDCCGFVWEPLGCGVREVGVVDGGLVLFGGRWGERETQVTPLTWDDMVLAQQHLKEDALPSVSPDFDTEKEKERGDMMEGEGEEGDMMDFDTEKQKEKEKEDPPEGDMMVAVATAETVSLSVSSVPSALSPSSPTFASLQGRRGKKGGQRRGFSQPVHCEAEFPAVLAPASENAGSSMLSADSAPFDGLSVCGGRPETSVSVSVRKRGNEVMEGANIDRFSYQALRFAPAVLKRREGVGGEKGDLLRGKTAESVNGLTGGYDSVSVPGLLVRESELACRDPLTEEQSVSVGCEGPKRRRLSSPSAPVSESQSGRGGGRAGKGQEPPERGPLPPRPSSRSLQGVWGCARVSGWSMAQVHCHLRHGEGRSAAAAAAGRKWRRQWKGFGRGEEKRVHRGGREGPTQKYSLSAWTGSVPLQGVHSEGARSVEGGVCVSTAAGARSARSVEGAASVSTVAFALGAKSVEGAAYVSTVAFALGARSVEGRVSVSTAANGANARSVEGRAYVNTVAFALSARIVEGKAFASMAESALRARSVEGRASVSTVAFALSARIAEGKVFASMAESALRARSVEGRVSVSTAASARSARSVEGRVSVSTVAFAISARSVEGRVSVSTAENAHSARSVEGRASVCTADGAGSARSVERQVFVSTATFARSARSVEGRASVFIEKILSTATSASSFFPLTP
eukprot:Cvel_31545.t1-p1 / transcript=Cvel_31545.t1 / gene=Cvel_31545 / organism=Chromera_velia_CCMP2878 / gene_product=Zinc finger protein 420, putative / transcript_product=Zinc finger protein 420, putative / location=Cvel_scaffold4718:2360-4853(+) / protein_length=779 / sequence_SO=supercontig / SO=protein_coding / is_pseudo=false